MGFQAGVNPGSLFDRHSILSYSNREGDYKILAYPEETERIAYRLYDPKVPEERT